MTASTNDSLGGTHFKGFLESHLETSLTEDAKKGNGVFDLVFIDADHEEEAVLADINMWEPRLRPGGILAGHDLRYKITRREE